MTNKIIVTEEEAEEIKKLYSVTNNYSEVNRQTGISITVIKRILEENLDKELEEKKIKVKELIYSGLPPMESNISLNFSFNTIIENFYKEILEKDGLL